MTVRTDLGFTELGNLADNGTGGLTAGKQEMAASDRLEKAYHRLGNHQTSQPGRITLLTHPLNQKVVASCRQRQRPNSVRSDDMSSVVSGSNGILSPATKICRQ